MEAEATLVGTESGVELDTETTVDLDLGQIRFFVWRDGSQIDVPGGCHPPKPRGIEQHARGRRRPEGPCGIQASSGKEWSSREWRQALFSELAESAPRTTTRRCRH